MINIIIKYILIYLIKLINKFNLIKKPGNGGIPAKFKKKNKLNNPITDNLLALLLEWCKLIDWNALNSKNDIVVKNE